MDLGEALKNIKLVIFAIFLTVFAAAIIFLYFSGGHIKFAQSGHYIDISDDNPAPDKTSKEEKAIPDDYDWMKTIKQNELSDNDVKKLQKDKILVTNPTL